MSEKDSKDKEKKRLSNKFGTTIGTTNTVRINALYAEYVDELLRNDVPPPSKPDFIMFFFEKGYYSRKKLNSTPKT